MKKIRLLILACSLVILAEAQTTIRFAGLTWNVKNGIGGPGPNNWSDSPSNVWVDADDQLHLKIRKSGNTWYCSEIIAQQSFGYGEYRFYVASSVEKYDPEIVTGLFTYETDNREIDIEFSHWGNTANAEGWFTVQPVLSGNQQSFTMNLQSENSTHKFIWGNSSIFFQSYLGHYENLPSQDSLIREWTYTGNYNPPAGNERLHINFWLFGGHAPVNQQEAEFVVKSVFVPLSTAVSVSPAVLPFDVSPNPFLSTIRIQIPLSNEVASLSVYNPAGSEVLRKSLFEAKSEIDLGNFSSGIYFLKLVYANRVEVRKIVKR